LPPEITQARALCEFDDVSKIKSEWFTGCPELPALGHHIRMLESRPRPCNNQCPWLVDNHGKTVKLRYDHEVPGITAPEEFTFAPWKRERVWADDLRDGIPGYGSLCHVRLPGTHQRSDGAWEIVGCQCTGALVMQQRELLRQVARGESTLSFRGAVSVAGEMLGREVTEEELGELDLRELLAHAHPSLLSPRIGSDAVAAPLSVQERQEWSLTLRSGYSTRLPSPVA
jgi:hypothetical protein